MNRNNDPVYLMNNFIQSSLNDKKLIYVRAQTNINWINMFYHTWILKQTTNYSYAVFNSICIGQVKQILYVITWCKLPFFTNLKTVHSHYNSSSGHHSTKIILSENITILPLLLVKRLFGIFV